MVHITSRVMKNMQFNHFPIITMGAFCCFGIQIKRRITITLAIFKPPHQATFLPNQRQMVLEGLPVNRRTDNGQKVIIIAYPEHSSGELKIKPQAMVVCFSDAAVNNNY